MVFVVKCSKCEVGGCEVLEVWCPRETETNYGNAIVEMGGGGELVAIVAMPLLKMGGKKNSGCQNLGRN